MAYIASSTAEEEISRLREKNERLTDDYLALLQQPEDEATNGSIKEDFGKLCQSIDFWVDNIIVEDSNLDKHSRKLGRKERYLLKELGVNWFMPRDEYSGAYLFLTLAVQREVQKRIFDRPYPIGITKQQESVIDQVLDGMQDLEFGKGKQAKLFVFWTCNLTSPRTNKTRQMEVRSSKSIDCSSRLQAKSK